jgi:hypothetical protein
MLNQVQHDGVADLMYNALVLGSLALHIRRSLTPTLLALTQIGPQCLGKALSPIFIFFRHTPQIALQSLTRPAALFIGARLALKAAMLP